MFSVVSSDAVSSHVHLMFITELGVEDTLPSFQVGILNDKI